MSVDMHAILEGTYIHISGVGTLISAHIVWYANLQEEYFILVWRDDKENN